MASKSPGLWAIFLLLLLFGPFRASGTGFCDPLLCTCGNGSAVCKSRGFLVYPSSLPQQIHTLDLTDNYLTSVNITELEIYPNLKRLVLKNNKISSFSGAPNDVLQYLDLSNNKISSLSRNVDLSLFENIRVLDLSNNMITTIPKAGFPNGRRLEVLNLSSNQIDILESNCFDDLTNLEELRLNKNKLSSFPKTLFKKMSKLRVLEMNKNKIVGIPGLTFHGLDNVRILKLRKNNIRSLMDGAFFGLSSMEQLYLDRNEVRTVSKGWLYGVKRLKQLSLAYNKVDFIEDDGWEFCTNLWQLDLRGNLIKIVSREILLNLPSLTHLDLGENLISHIEAEGTFDQVPRLRVLTLDGNQISHTIEDTPSTFKVLKDLRNLTLAANHIKSVGRNALTGLHNLEYLDLSNNVISTIQENPFTDMPLLRTVVLNSSSLLCDCNIRWFAEWLNATQAQGVSATCAHPEPLKTRPIWSVASESFTCEDTPKPFLLVEPETQIALRGKDLTLTCSAASTLAEPMTFTWKQDTEVLTFDQCQDDSTEAVGDESSIGSRSCIKDMSDNSDGKVTEMTSELRIKNLTHHDSGKYQCIVKNQYGATYSGKADITVYVFPKFTSTPSDITVHGGEIAVLECSATGYPTPRISWSKDNGGDFPAAKERRFHVNTETNTFSIHNVKPADMGMYTCTAGNLAGAITTNITLSVLDKPRFVKPMESKTVKVGETAVMECIASGSPKPILKWKLNKGPLYPTERHFFTADNQLLIIVNVRLADAGAYECEMENQLGTVSQDSFLTIEGGEVVASGDPTTGIIVVAVVCCVLATSLVWVCIIYYTRRKSGNNRWELTARNESGSIGGGMTSLGESGLPLIQHRSTPIAIVSDQACMQSISDHGSIIGRKPLALPLEDSASERDSGTGDSKRSIDNMEAVVDSVIHNFLSARGVGKFNDDGEWCVSPPPMSDLDTGISSISGHGLYRGDVCPNSCYTMSTSPGSPGDMSVKSPLVPAVTILSPAASEARRSCGNECLIKSTPNPCSSHVSTVVSELQRPLQRMHSNSSNSCSKPNSESPSVKEMVAVGNPLYDTLPVVSSNCDTKSAPTANYRPISPAASMISDSVAYCGRFPPADRRMCSKCGELLSECPHHEALDEVSSVSSAGVSSTGQSSAPSTSMSDQPLGFQTFHPLATISGAAGMHAANRYQSTDHIGSGTGSLVGSTFGSTMLSPLSGCQPKEGKNRRSAIEFPTGETYLPIEPSALDRCSNSTLVMDAKEYRGGGTLPRRGLQQEWLEASLNCSKSNLDHYNQRNTLTRNKDTRGSKISLFRRSTREKREPKRRESDLGAAGSLGRRKRRSTRRQSEGKDCEMSGVYADEEHTNVHNKSADMFS